MEKKICSIGVSDLTYNQLSDLYDHAEHIKPSLTQINLESCCDIPEDLSKFAKTNSITVLTHNDTSEILQMDKIQNFSFERSFKSHPKWLARYTFVLSDRGVVTSKGYMLSILSI
ncbi:hypothetical protein QR98_0005860 [Sarcoptes scabiei]|uniref:GCS light chain n=1 Tax=Sarcoptes scabiei TaxID=52283 RepID=A0A131ZUG4_SARSC|nr:hypothetical protein QR98_0005860 [Sarcoptes scabiei]